jgi:hypothetical protein
MRLLVRVVHLSRLSGGLDGMACSTSKPETCSVVVTQSAEERQWIRLASLHAYVEMHGQQNINVCVK